MSKQKMLCLFYLFVGYSFFGFSFLFSKWGLAVATPFVLLAFRFGIAFVLLDLTCRFARIPLSFRGKPKTPLLLLGFFQPILYFICEMYGIQRASISLSGTMLALIPIITLILGAIFLRERVTPLQLFFFLLSLVGVVLTTVGQLGGETQVLGLVLIGGAALSDAVFITLSRRQSGAYSALERTYAMCAMGTVIFGALALVQSWGNWESQILYPLSQWKFWVAVGFLGVLCSFCSFFIINYALGYMPASSVSIFANMTTVISIWAGVWILHESFTIPQAIGSALILLSVYMITRPQKEPNAKKHKKVPILQH